MIFGVLYATATASLPLMSPWFGRVALPCWASGGKPLGAATPLTCALNRNYVRPAVAAALVDLSRHVASRHPDATIRYLDAGFPLLDGFPILPHLSHRHGVSVDLALPGLTSPFGYWIYVQPRPGDSKPCADMSSWLRWDFDFWQGWLGDAELEEQILRDTIQWLAGSSSVRRMLLEQHLQERLGVAGRKIRFQGCHAARHDDHLHVDFH